MVVAMNFTSASYTLDTFERQDRVDPIEHPHRERQGDDEKAEQVGEHDPDRRHIPADEQVPDGADDSVG
jgi:hypothetical protein